MATAAVLLCGCDGGPPDRRADVDRLTQQIAAMPGVRSVRDDLTDSPAQGVVTFRINVDVSDEVTDVQLAAVVRRYLSELASGRYTGYRAELDARRGWSVFAVDSGKRPIANGDQIVEQAKDWVALRREFPSATVSLRATIVHPGGGLAIQEFGHSKMGRIDLAGASDFTTAAATVGVLAARFAKLAELDWTVNAGKLHPAEITTSRRFPTVAELDVWKTLNTDQSIPHIDALRINSPLTPPVWFSEKTTQSRDVAVALQLARRHLPVVATLPAPILYTASDHLSGHIGGSGNARGPVSVTIGGCTPHDPLVYVPITPEQALIDRYSNCGK